MISLCHLVVKFCVARRGCLVISISFITWLALDIFGVFLLLYFQITEQGHNMDAKAHFYLLCIETSYFILPEESVEIREACVRYCCLHVTDRCESDLEQCHVIR